jgi:hypothetical protein
MSTDIQNPPLYIAEPIQELLAGLRRKIRSYVWLHGIGLAVAWLAASFWITLALDWMIEPPPAFRALVLVVVAAVLMWLVYRYILARAFVPMGDTSMAVLLERRYDEFNDSLLTTVELAGKPAHAAAFNPEMLDWTTAEALGHTRRVRLNELLQNAPLMRAVFAAIVLSLSVAAFAVAAPDAFEIWVRRVLLMSEELWPRKTRLSIDGFNDDKLVKVARGGDFRVVAYADRSAEVPETVQIRFRDDEGNLGRQTMAAEAVGPGDDRQAFSHSFPGLLASLTFDIVGGDDRLRDYRIEVVDNPTVSNMSLHCVYPAYMRRSPRDLPVTGLMQIPVGTKVTLRASANKPLEIAHIERVVEQGLQSLTTITKFTGGERRDFSLELPPLVEDMRLQFRLHDTDGIVGRNPVRLDLAAVADEAPKVGLQLRGIGTAITTRARLPVVGEVADDYGVERIWFEYQVDDAEPQTAAFLASPAGKNTLAIAPERPEVLDLKELQEAAGLAAERETNRTEGATEKANNNDAQNGQGSEDAATDVAKLPAQAVFQLKEDQRLSLVVKAQDQSTLEGGPFIGVGEKYQLNVVSPDRLLAMLEARELQLRQRFETIIEEFTATRDLLVRVDLGPKPSGGDADVASAKPEARLEGAEPEDAADAKPADSEAQDNESQLTPAEKVAQERASRLLAVERTLENTQRAAHETRTVGTAFHEILEEMANNRIDTPALSGRLRDEIADPLVALAEKRLPVLATRLAELQKLINDADRGTAKLDEAIREADAILLEMQAILDKMIEMATYKELVEKLRKVIEQQEELNKATKQRQVENLKKLIDE